MRLIPHRVYVTSGEIPEEALRIVRGVAEVRVNPARGPPSREALLGEVEEADGLYCLLTEKVDAELMERGRRLKVIASMSVGYDHVDVAEATRRGIIVTNTPGVLTETVADATMGLILAVARRIPEGDRYVRSGGWRISWTPMMMVGRDVHGKVLGIYGLGRIGAAVATRARGFGMRLIYHGRTRRPDLEAELGVEYRGMEELLAESDFLSVHVPLTDETRHAIGSREMRMMKRTAYIINTSRGAVVDEAALAAALSEGRISGAALDVFEKEPPDASNPLLKMENVVLAPHLGSASVETRTKMAVMAAENLAAALGGGVPPNIVNPAAIPSKDK